jgi:phosphoribosylanthranilate isomerase
VDWGKGQALRVKICGITQPQQGCAIAQMGVAALGFICAPRSPRYVTVEQIAAVVAALPVDRQTQEPLCARVGVFVNAEIETIGQTVAKGQLSSVQLHGNESPEFCDRLRAALPPQIELIKAFRVRAAADITATQEYENVVDALLLDAYQPNQEGGTGHRFDWQLLEAFRPLRPWFLAGGLTPDNVVQAMQQVNPPGIDLSSGVERSPGDKDLIKCQQLMQRLSRGIG